MRARKRKNEATGVSTIQLDGERNILSPHKALGKSPKPPFMITNVM